MNITSENYKELFSAFNQKIDGINAEGNVTVANAIASLKDEFARKEQGSDALLADNSVLKIGIVGQVKAGKSSFLNSLFFDGENILPRASVPMTAGLTVLKYGEENKFVVEYFNEKEWSYFKDKAAEYDQLIQNGKALNPNATNEDIEKQCSIDDVKKSAHEMVSKCSRAALANIHKVSKKEEKAFGNVNELQNILEDYVGANGKLTSVVKCLTLQLTDERLRGLQIVDTPGMNDPVLSREMRTREFLQECHGVFFLSVCSRFFSSTDVNFLVNRIGSQGIGTVVLIGSQLDGGLVDASGKYRDDLGNALDYVKTSLERQFRRNIADADFSGDDPILDVNSGIGYSIAKKGRARWDSMEAHTVSRMCELYPSYFDTDENIRKMFAALANIDGEDGIRARYIDGLFRENMDKIIQQKLCLYFANASSDLTKVLTDKTEEVKAQLERLKEGGNPEEMRKAMLSLVEGIKKEMLSIMSRVDNRADKAVKDVKNAYSMNWDGRIPVTSASVRCQRESTFWGRDKSFNVNIEVIDASALTSNVKNLIGKCLDELSRDWDKKNLEIRKFISDSIIDFIHEQEKHDTDNKIDGRMLNSILNETLDEMTNVSTLDIADIKNRAESDIPDLLIDCDSIDSSVGEMSEDAARNEMLHRVQANKADVSRKIREYLNGIFPDVSMCLKKAADASASCIKDKKGEFIGHITDEINAKIDELEQQIQDRDTNIRILSDSITKLENLQKQL